MAQKWLLMMLLVVCITKKHQANALGFFLDTDTIHTVSKMTADLESSKMSLLPFSMPVLQTGDTEVCIIQEGLEETLCLVSSVAINMVHLC